MYGKQIQEAMTLARELRDALRELVTLLRERNGA